MPRILPELKIHGALDVTRICTVVAAPSPEMMVRTGPFGAPHHTGSHVGWWQGGRVPHP